MSRTKQALGPAVSAAFDTYNNAAERCRYSTREYGSIVWWNEETDQLLPFNITSGKKNEISLYPVAIIPSILEKRPSQLYAGDWHTHPPDGDLIEQLPSPDDLLQVSALVDFWPLTDDSISCVRIAPSFQLIQSALFGDMFVVERATCRTPFASLKEQSKEIAEMIADYATWFDLQRQNWGHVGRVIDRKDWHDIANSALTSINQIISQRAIITYRINEDNASDSIDASFGIQL